jgi:hypothetical protein
MAATLGSDQEYYCHFANDDKDGPLFFIAAPATVT